MMTPLELAIVDATELRGKIVTVSNVLAMLGDVVFDRDENEEAGEQVASTIKMLGEYLCTISSEASALIEALHSMKPDKLGMVASSDPRHLQREFLEADRGNRRRRRRKSSVRRAS